MKKYISLMLMLLLLQSCNWNPNPIPNNRFSAYAPVLITRSDADQQIGVVAPQSVVAAGKFYIYQNMILLIEKNMGVHVYDNTDPNDPKNIAFLKLLNCTDVAISKDVLYANQSTDLLTLDISDLNHVKLISRIPNVSTDLPPDNLPLDTKYVMNRPENTIVAMWEKIK